MDNIVKLDYTNMQEYFRQTSEFVFLDQVSIIPGQSAEGVKLASAQDWYFKYHFPSNPMMPGVFQMEALMQTGGLIINTMDGKKEEPLLFGECKSVQIRKSVRPGDIMKTKVSLESHKRGISWFQAEAYVDDQISCKMKFSLISPNEISKIMNTERGKNEEVT